MVFSIRFLKVCKCCLSCLSSPVPFLFLHVNETNSSLIVSTNLLSYKLFLFYFNCLNNYKMSLTCIISLFCFKRFYGDLPEPSSIIVFLVKCYILKVRKSVNPVKMCNTVTCPPSLPLLQHTLHNA